MSFLSWLRGVTSASSVNHADRVVIDMTDAQMLWVKIGQERVAFLSRERAEDLHDDLGRWLEKSYRESFDVGLRALEKNP